MSLALDTIGALSTPPGEAGLAVVRVSGPGALEVLGRFFRTGAGERHAEPWEHRRLYHGRVIDAASMPIDEVMVAVMRGPESYTGEDIVEVSCHGGSAVVARLLETLFAHGVRPAGPGEFTRRAFLNGKMDLIQAEAVADLIHARSELQRVVAERQLRGALSERIDTLADEMLGLLGVIEANIDFVEEGIDALDIAGALATLARHRQELDALLASAALSRPLREGYQVTLAGPVNAGKSSLFNRIVGEARAIVTEIPGTTRDVLRETVVIDGVAFVLHDTAGLRGAIADRVESIGVGLTHDAVRAADVVLFVIDGSDPDGLPVPARDALAERDPARTVLVVNKTDMPVRSPAAAARPELTRVNVSAVNGDGLDDLRRAMQRLAGADDLSRMARDRSILNARLGSLLGQARGGLGGLESMLAAREPLELLASQAREVLSYYEEATGRRYHDGLLDAIFTRFCIGK